VRNSAVGYFICIGLLVLIPVLFLIQVMSDRLKLTPFGLVHLACGTNWEYAPAAVITGVELLVIFPILTIAFRKYHDDYGIWTELVWSAVIWELMLIGYIALAVFMPTRALGYASPGIVICAGMVILQYLLIIRPVWLHYHLRKRWRTSADTDRAKAGTRRAFELLLNDPNMFEDFKTFSTRNLSVGNVLFFERVARLRRHPPTSQELLVKEQRRIYYHFLRDRSDLRLGISENVLRAVQLEIKMGRHRPELFDTALEEVLVQMYSETFPRFLRSRKSGFIADLGQRSGLPPGALFHG